MNPYGAADKTPAGAAKPSAPSRPPNAWPYNQISPEEGERRAVEADRQSRELKLIQDNERRKLRDEQLERERRYQQSAALGQPSVMSGPPPASNIGGGSSAASGAIGSTPGTGHAPGLASGSSAKHGSAMPAHHHHHHRGHHHHHPTARLPVSNDPRDYASFSITPDEILKRQQLQEEQQRLVEKNKRKEDERRKEPRDSSYSRPRQPSPAKNLPPLTASQSPQVATATPKTTADPRSAATATSRYTPVDTPRSPEKPSVRPPATASPAQPRHNTYSGYSGYMAYQPPKPADPKPPAQSYSYNMPQRTDRNTAAAEEKARMQKRKEEERRQEENRPERPYVYKPDPLPGPPPPSATGREYQYNPRDKRPRMDTAVENASSKPKRAKRERDRDLPDNYRKLAAPPGGIIMENAPRDWSALSEAPRKGYSVSNEFIDDWLATVPLEKRQQQVTAWYTGKDWTAARAGLARQDTVGSLIKLRIPIGFLNDDVKIRGEDNFDETDPAWHADALGLHEDYDEASELLKPYLFGTDVYTCDSQIGAMLVHAGFVRWGGWKSQPRSQVPAPGKSGLEVVLRVAPALSSYTPSIQRGVQSKGWGNSHDGFSVMIEDVRRITFTKEKPTGRKGLKDRLRAALLDRQATFGESADQSEPPVKISSKEGAFLAYAPEHLTGWLDKMGERSIWTRDLQLLGTGGEKYEFYHLGGDVDEAHLFSLYQIEVQDKDKDKKGDVGTERTIAEQIGLEDVYFLPAGIAYRDEHQSHGMLIPLAGYRWTVRSPEASFKFEGKVGPIRKQSAREARELAGKYRLTRTGSAKDFPEWARRVIEESVQEWNMEREDALIRRGWTEPLERMPRETSV